MAARKTSWRRLRRRRFYRKKYDISQNSVSTVLGALRYLLEKKVIPQPTHIKIDVDGIDSKVIEGGINTIKNCKTVLVEVENMEIVNSITI